MERLIAKYAKKLSDAGLSRPEDIVLGGLDAELAWNRPDPLTLPATGPLPVLFDHLNINSLLFAKPAGAYAPCVDFLAREALATGAPVRPEDCETRTFLHDLPVVPELSPELLIPALKRRKAVIVPGRGVLAFGTVSPEQAFVTYSSTLFSCFVKFLLDCLRAKDRGEFGGERARAFEQVLDLLPPPRTDLPTLAPGPFADEEAVYRAMDEAGAATVSYGLVDSYFGNISYLRDGVLYISQTGSSLDELPGAVDPCPLDGSSCAGLTASSEFTAHRRVIETTGMRSILHGHPRFSVILSMDCALSDCPNLGQCHIKCDRPRFVGDIPIVPGEVGVGPTGLCNTLPPAMRDRRAVLVYGHGLFAVGRTDFNEPFATLLSVENGCRARYLERMEA